MKEREREREREKERKSHTWCNSFHRKKWLPRRDLVVCMSHSANTHEKAMNPTIRAPILV